jgi:hypothetical protein
MFHTCSIYFGCANAALHKLDTYIAAELLGHSQIVTIRPSRRYRKFSGAIRMFAHKRRCRHNTQTGFTQKDTQLVKRPFVVTVAIYGYCNRGRTLGRQLCESLQRDRRRMSAIHRHCRHDHTV